MRLRLPSRLRTTTPTTTTTTRVAHTAMKRQKKGSKRAKTPTAPAWLGGPLWRRRPPRASALSSQTSTQQRPRPRNDEHFFLASFFDGLSAFGPARRVCEAPAIRDAFENVRHAASKLLCWVAILPELASTCRAPVFLSVFFFLRLCAWDSQQRGFVLRFHCRFLFSVHLFSLFFAFLFLFFLVPFACRRLY